MTDSLISKLTEVLTELKRLEAEETKLKEAIKAEMMSSNEDTYDDDFIKITYVPETTAKVFDSARFKKENPKAYELFSKETPKKAYMRFTLK